MPHNKDHPTGGGNKSKKPSIDKEQYFFPRWNKLSDAERIQFAIAIVAIFTFIIIGISTYDQGCQIRKSLALTDTSNYYVKQSISDAKSFALLKIEPTSL